MNEKNTQNVIPNVNSKKKEERNVPDLRFKGFEKDWNITTISNDFIFLTTNSFSRDDLNYQTGYRKNIHYGDILTKYTTVKDINDNNVPFINDNIKISGSSIKLKTGDIIIADTAEDFTVGKTIEIYNPNELEVYSGLHTIPLRSINKFSNGYLAYYFNSYNFKKRMFPLIQGIKVYSISKSALSSMIIKYPTLEEQTKIAKILINIDSRISTQKKIIEKIKTQINLISHAMVTLISQVVPLNDICFFESKTKHQSGDGLPKGTYPFFTNEEETIKYFNSYDFDGEYIIANTGGKANFKYFAGKFASMSDCLVIGFKNQSLTYFYSIVFSALQNYIDYIGFEGSGLKHLNKEWLLKLNVPQYCKQAEKFTYVIKNLKKKLEKEKDMLELYKKQKVYLLQNMFI